MPQIDGIIPPQAFEVVRNRIAEILADEIDHQFQISYDAILDLDVSVERFVPFDHAEMPAVNVSFDNGRLSEQHQGQSNGLYTYNIDCYASAKSSDSEDADTLAKFRLHKLLGVCRAILENPRYKTLGFTPPFVMNRHVEDFKFSKPVDHEGTSAVMGRITLVVKVPEDAELITADLIAGYYTQVKMALTEKGYIFSGDSIPVPPVTGGSVTVNGVDFGIVAVGDTLNIVVVNEDNEPVGTKIGSAWVVPNGGGSVTIKDQDGNTVAVVEAPGEYTVLVFSEINDSTPTDIPVDEIIDDPFN